MLAVSLVAQNNPPATPDISNIPAPRGVYYHATSGWISLAPKVLMPLFDERHLALEILNVGSDHTLTHLAGRRAGVQIGNDARPTFYLHGIDPGDLYLVHFESRHAYREARMTTSRHFWDWTHYRNEDVTDFEIAAVNGDVVAIRPAADLKPGEYVLASGLGEGYQSLQMGFDFGILGGQ